MNDTLFLVAWGFMVFVFVAVLRSHNKRIKDLGFRIMTNRKHIALLEQFREKEKK